MHWAQALGPPHLQRPWVNLKVAGAEREVTMATITQSLFLESSPPPPLALVSLQTPQLQLRRQALGQCSEYSKDMAKGE